MSSPRVVVLREVTQAQSLLQELRELGAQPVSVPLLAFEPIHHELINEPFTAICFTSANGVRFFLQVVKPIQKIYAVGPKTNAKLQEYGLNAFMIPEEHSVRGLLNMLPDDLSQEYFLLPIAEIAPNTLEEGLKQKGARVKVLRTYRTLLLEPQFDLIKDNDWVIFTSPSMVDHFFSYKKLREKEIIPFSIGPSTTEALKNYYSRKIYPLESLKMRLL